MLFFVQYSFALVLDLLFGDPEWFPHPVRIIGKFCTIYEKGTRRFFTSALLAGGVTVFLVISTTATLLGLLLYAAHSIAAIAGVAAAVFALYTCVAIRDLLRHSKAVFHSLYPNVNLDEARRAVGKIVGRDTAHLGEPAIVRACVETVAENMVDGITAPVFYGVVGGIIGSCCGVTPVYGAAIGSMVYKSINTMDSMFGYKNDNYLYFGRIAARLDDLANFLPARLTGLFVIFAAFLCKLDYRKAAMIYRRDRMNHSSPNAGHTEAAIAGALGIRLGGPSFYFGKEVVKPYMGDDERPVKAGDIVTANRVVTIGALVFYLVLFLPVFFL